MKAILLLFRELLTVLPHGAKRFINTYSTALGVLAIFDAAALGLLAAVVGPLAAGQDVTLPFFGVIEGQGLVVAIVSITLLMLMKGFISVALLAWMTRRFSGFELEIGARLFDGYISAPWAERLKKNSSDIVRYTDTSLFHAMSAFLFPGSTILGEVLSLIAIVTVLAVFQPLIALVTVVYLGSISAMLYLWVARRARNAGRANLKHSLATARLVTEMVGAMKELTLRGKNDEVANVVRGTRSHATRARASILFLNQLPRFVLESAIVGGFIVVGLAAYATGGPAEALTAVALFALAGFRMAPSAIRLMSVASIMTSNAPHARAVVDEITSLETAVASHEPANRVPLADDPQTLELKGVGFRYPGASVDVLSDVSITLPFGSQIAIVGSSGAGKSTLVDVILGLLEPSAGSISIDGVPLADVSESWRSRVGFVPQEVALFDATIAQNVALSWNDDFDRERVVEALRRAQLLETVEAREGGLDAVVGERGMSLSGGQRQRLGIARALYADPYVLVLDEATSALDTETERAVATAIGALAGKRTTTIVVAHRLATVRNSDSILFMRDGKVVSVGTFDELVDSVPEFARQAQLAGLM